MSVVSCPIGTSSASMRVVDTVNATKATFVAWSSMIRARTSMRIRFMCLYDLASNRFAVHVVQY